MTQVNQHTGFFGATCIYDTDVINPTRTGTHDNGAAAATRGPTHPEPLVDVVHQREQLDEVVHGDGDDGRAEGGRGESDEAALPLECEHGEQGPGAQEDAQGDPHGPGVVELLHDLQEQ